MNAGLDSLTGGHVFKAFVIFLNLTWLIFFVLCWSGPGWHLIYPHTECVACGGWYVGEAFTRPPPHTHTHWRDPSILFTETLSAEPKVAQLENVTQAKQDHPGKCHPACRLTPSFLFFVLKFLPIGLIMDAIKKIFNLCLYICQQYACMCVKCFQLYHFAGNKGHYISFTSASYCHFMCSWLCLKYEGIHLSSALLKIKCFLDIFYNCT